MSNDFNFTEIYQIPGYPIDHTNDFDFPLEVPTYYSIIKGLNSEFTHVSATPNASLHNGKFYIAAKGYFTVIDLNNHSVFDWYSTTHSGMAKEALDSDDLIDSHVSL